MFTQTQQDRQTLTLLLLKCVGSIWILLSAFNLWIGADTDDVYRSIAKQYNIPFDDVKEMFDPYISARELKFFPIAHYAWYLTVEETGEDIQIASDFFGGEVCIYKNTLDERIGMNKISSLYKY